MIFYGHGYFKVNNVKSRQKFLLYEQAPKMVVVYFRDFIEIGYFICEI